MTAASFNAGTSELRGLAGDFCADLQPWQNEYWPPKLESNWLKTIELRDLPTDKALDSEC